MSDDDLAIGPPLLSYLRDALNEPHLDYSHAPLAVSGGFETAISAFELIGSATMRGPLILRVFRGHVDPLRASFEQAVHNSLSDANYPVPRIHLACTDPSVLGGGFVIMDRLPGKTLLDDFLSLSTILRLRTRAFRFVSNTLAALQLRLHSLDAAAVRQAVLSSGLPESAEPGRLSARALTFDGQLDQLDYRLQNARLDGLRAGLEWLHAERPTSGEAVLCHGDFHPLNILSRRGHVTGVIDWQLATVAPPAFDVGNTMMLMTLAPSRSGALDAIRRSTARRYLAAYTKERPLDAREVEYYVAYRCLRSLAWAGETRQAAAGVISDRGPNPWHLPEVANKLIARFAEISGAVVSLP